MYVHVSELWICVYVLYVLYVCACVQLGESQYRRGTPFNPALPIEQMSCLERKVYDLQCERDSQKAAIQDLQSEQGVLCQRMDSVDMQSRGR